MEITVCIVKIGFLVETQSVQSAPAGDKLTPYPADQASSGGMSDADFM